MSQRKDEITIGGVLNACFLVLGLLGLVMLFVNFGNGLFCLFIAVVCLFAWLQTPEGKAFSAAQAAAAAAEQKALKTIRTNMQQLIKAPKNTDLKEEVVQSLMALAKPDASMIREVALKLLELYPADSKVRQTVMLSASRCLAVPNSGFNSKEVYDLALKILEKYPKEPRAKTLVLEIGRWHFGKLRSGVPTIYDEQAMQNDIMVRQGN